MVECKHDNGWILKDEISIMDDGEDNIEAIFECNNIGCGCLRKLKFDINNVEVVD